MPTARESRRARNGGRESGAYSGGYRNGFGPIPWISRGVHVVGDAAGFALVVASAFGAAAVFAAGFAAFFGAVAGFFFAAGFADFFAFFMPRNLHRVTRDGQRARVRDAASRRSGSPVSRVSTQSLRSFAPRL